MLFFKPIVTEFKEKVIFLKKFFSISIYVPVLQEIPLSYSYTKPKIIPEPLKNVSWVIADITAV